MTSWIANKAVEHGEKDQLGAIFSGYSIIGTPLTMAATFVGANILGNIRLNLPLLIGAAFLLATSLTIIPLLKYDSQNLAEAEEGMPKLNQVADCRCKIHGQAGAEDFCLDLASASRGNYFSRSA